MNKFGSFNIKVALLISGVLIALFILLYTQIIVDKIRVRETEIAKLYGKSLEYIANDTTNTSGEYGFIFNEIITQIDFPIIATDKDYTRVDFYKNLDIDTTLKKSERDKQLIALAKEMAELSPPIKVSYMDSLIFNYIHYGQSDLVTKLKYLPILEFIIGGIFLLLGYIGFSYIKKAEQSSIWVGLSRETAHQLGTPLSSLIGWSEILKSSENLDDSSKEIVNEIGNDLDKLNKIAGRFSKIGSQPKLECKDIVTTIKNVAEYFEKRIPSLIGTDGLAKKKVSIQINSPDSIKALINTDLFEWVIENLFKNALDAIEKHSGIILINISSKDNDIIIDVSDNGKGIDKRHRKDIFRPGYSTKKRGWGLGLSLSKRIIEDYHSGKLTLSESILEKGTTFRIKLKAG